MNVSKEIIKVREAKRIKQSEVAEKLNMERPNYSRIEKRGLKMSLEQLIQIADALEVPFMDLLKDSDNPTINPEVAEIKKENKELRDKILDLESDKKLLKEGAKRVQQQMEEVYIKTSFLVILPFIFKEFTEIIKSDNVKEYSNESHRLFEKLISFDRDSHKIIYPLNYWKIESSYVAEMMEYDRLLIKTLNGIFNEAIVSEYFALFKKEYSKYLANYIQKEEDSLKNEIRNL
ncbi:MAG: helix-turn-helix domain-containing protein [Arcicella sp.]|jgi:transcriptional regulator with XRE-family HTH domain|nr:helix-turn-helix domain-containing protein [Arcicella sp.]